jgi:hypothetical protein
MNTDYYYIGGKLHSSCTPSSFVSFFVYSLLVLFLQSIGRYRAVCHRTATVTMRFLAIVAGVLSTCGLLCAAESSNITSSRLVLPKDFKPPQVFKNANMVRNTNLDKGYVRETINVVVENTDKKPQSDYYLPFPAGVFDRVGGLEVRDKKSPEKGRIPAAATQIGGERLVLLSLSIGFMADRTS